VWCKILRDSTQGQNLIVGVCYKSPNADSNEVNELFKVIEKAAKDKVIITGDFNFPGINWDTLECEANTQDFRDLVLDNYLDQHVLKPTRESNILDLVLTSNDLAVEKMMVEEHLGNSDHNVLTWNLIYSLKLKKEYKIIRMYHRGDYVGMRKWLEQIDWASIMRECSVEMWKKFCEKILQGIDKFVPRANMKSRHYPKWMNKEAKLARKTKLRKWKIFQQTKSYNDSVEYKIASKKATKVYKKAKKTFEIKLANEVKNNPKSFYAYVRSKTSVKDVVGPLRANDGKLVTDNGDMCKILNDFFASVFTDEAGWKDFPEVKKG
jgi:hypothetical protein